MRHCWKTWVSCWNPRPRATRCGRCGGPGRATRNWRRGCAQWGTRSARAPSRSQACGAAIPPAGIAALAEPRPGRTVRAYQFRDDRHAGGRQAGDLDRHQEEGADRFIQKRRQRLRRKAVLTRSRCTTLSTPNSARPPLRCGDIAANAGCVSVGIDNDTAQFSVNSIRCRLNLMGRERYPNTRSNHDHRGWRRFQRIRACGQFKVELRRSWPTKPDRRCRVCHQSAGDVRSGTRLSTGCFATLPRTGGARR